MSDDTDQPTPTEPRLDEPDTFEIVPIPVFETDPPEGERPRVRVVDDTLIVGVKHDDDVRLALAIPHRLIADMEEKEPREQLYILLRSRGDEAMVDRLEGLDWVDSAEVVRKFHQAVGEKQQARLGESVRSSSSSRSTVQP